MIISASRRTDIPAFYSEWFVNRLQEGKVLVRNPMNFHQVSRIALSPENVECLVFWTKNPEAMLPRLAAINDLGYHYYFLFTLTPYDGRIEVNVPAALERITLFQTLAEMIGKEKVIWRYDPILFTNHYSTNFHITAFARIAERLAGCTVKCIVSYVEMYRKCERNMKGLTLDHPSMEQRINLLRTLQTISSTHGITLQTCAAGNYLKDAGIFSGRCIDDQLITRITGKGIRAGKDKNQRRECGCIESIDIGAYNSCPHGCLYCYANNDRTTVAQNFAAHNPETPLLYEAIGYNDKITDRLPKRLSHKQLQLFSD
ncbi:MAG: DUF1848 domain-containing protein [Proteobacteria bacterium]|nr:DUF1848 domain-containing protein [Pseudomonadota bacterium]